jgi:hypothetical protein
MATLLDYCTLVRSKNAGPFVLTFDLVCRDETAYQKLIASRAITRETFSALYKVDAATVQVFLCEAALALKISIPRPHRQGAIDDPDCYGGQQHALLLELQLPRLAAESDRGYRTSAAH